MQDTMRISVKEMKDTLQKIFLKHGFQNDKASILADVFTENTLCGVNSHGINRVPVFIDFCRRGLIKIDAEAEKAECFGSIERWDGHFGPGIINAIKCAHRAIKLARDNGMGLVALRNTNHWMRGGYYGWQAANAGCISILFTNTIPNMPPWGGSESRIGNNPFIVSIPRKEGHIVLDMALSQFSFGKIHEYKLKGEKLPFPGGWDENDQLSDNPEKILKKERGLPIGYWKGSALSMILDMLATLLSAGDSTSKIGQRGEETGVSQVFLCIDPSRFGDSNLQEKLLDEIIRFTHEVEPMQPGNKTYFPGERLMKMRSHNLNKGIPVDNAIWNEVLEL